MKRNTIVARTPAGMLSGPALIVAVCLGLGASACAAHTPPKNHTSLQSLAPQARLDILKRAQVWVATDVSAIDVTAGPQDAGAFASGQAVTCTYVATHMNGASPKFMCDLGSDEVKVKYGRDNGEVYGEVAATRLLWALGFGADHVYPVRVTCHDCPTTLTDGPAGTSGDATFDVATIERKMHGKEVGTHENQGWAWPELELVEERAGGAPAAQRDALKLLAAIMQDTDSKPEQQRLLCLDARTSAEDGASCEHPFMILNDLGLTFGRANLFNLGPLSSVNFDRWSHTPVWKGRKGCVANMSKSLSGSLKNPKISDEGRQFLADLLVQLSDAQIHDLFEVSRFALRSRSPENPGFAPAMIDQWVDAFRSKRDEVVNRRCGS